MLHLTQLNIFDRKVDWEKYTSEIFTAKIVFCISYTAGFYFAFLVKVMDPNRALLASRTFMWRSTQLEG